MEKHELAYEDYKTGMKYKDIAEKYGVSLDTVKNWKKRHWPKSESKKSVKGDTKNMTQNKKVSQQKASGEDAPDIENEIVICSELTDKQRLFCLYYVKYRNKTKAYQKAYKASWDTANSHAYKLWENEGVRKEINRLLNRYREDIELDIKDLFQWYLDIARADINDFVSITEEGITVRDGYKIDGTLISEVKEGRHGISVKLVDRHKAMDWLSEHIGLADEEQRVRIEAIKRASDLKEKEFELKKSQQEQPAEQNMPFADMTDEQLKELKKLAIEKTEET